jgi:SAM-dependent methyltransferase
MNHFDLVHERFMLCAWTYDQWKIALRNYFDVLKPGGYLQLYELDCRSKETWNLGPWALAGYKPGLALAAQRGIKPEIVEDLPVFLQDVGFQVVSQDSYLLDWSHKASDDEPFPGVVKYWYEDTARVSCSKARELGLMTEEEFQRFEEGVKDEWESSDKTDWRFTSAVIIARVSKDVGQ